MLLAWPLPTVRIQLRKNRTTGDQDWTHHHGEAKCENGDPMKTEALVLIKMNGVRVMVVPQAKYLGVILDRKHNFATHINYVANKANTLASRMKGLAASCCGLQATNLRLLYTRAVMTTASYVAIV